MKYPSKSTTDPIIPSNYLSFRQVVTAENLNAERAKMAIETTFARIQAKQIELGFQNLNQFKSFYNNLSNNLITNKEVNYLLTIGTISPIAHLFKLFVSHRISRTRTDCNGGNIYEVVDFGILRNHFEYWKKHHNPPNVQNRGNTKKNFNNPAENPRTKIEFINGGTIDVPKNPIYKQFAEGIKAANAVSTQKVTIPQMTLVAMQMLMDSRPDVFGQLEQSVAPDSLLTKKSNSRISADISPETTRKMNDTIQRYNSANAVPITQSQFVELAILHHLGRIPAEYTDPELAEELKEQDAKHDN